MITIREARLVGGSLVDENDLADATNIILQHLSEDPEFLRTAPHTRDGAAEWCEVRNDRVES